MLLDVFHKVDYLFKLSVKETAEQELMKLSNNIMQSAKEELIAK